MKAIHAMTFGLALVIPEGLRAADTLGVLAVASPPGPSSELVELTGQLRGALATRSPGVLEPAQMRERMATQPPRTSLTELDRTYESARDAYVNGDYDGSVRTLRSIIESLEQLPDSDEAFKQWTRAKLRLAKAESDLGHQEAVRTTLDELLRAYPAVAVDPMLYLPKFVRQVEEARVRLKATPAQRLTVTSLASDARVYVDGQEIASAPVTVTLPRGRHKVSGARGASHLRPIQVDLDTEEVTVVLDFDLPAVWRPSAGPGLVLTGGDRTARIQAAGASLEVDQLFTVSIAEERVASYLVGTAYQVSNGTVKREGRVRLSNRTVPPGGMAALAEYLLKGRTASGLVEVTQPATAASPPDLRVTPPAGDLPQRLGAAPKSKTLGWVAFSSGIATVVLGGVAIWQAAAASSSYSEADKLRLPDGTSTDPPRFNALRNEGASHNRVALVAGIGAGACAVTTGILGYLAYKQTGEVGPFRF